MCLISVKILYAQRFNISVRDMLVKSDFISKLAIKHEASKSKASLAKENSSLLHNHCLLGVSVVGRKI